MKDLEGPDFGNPTGAAASNRSMGSIFFHALRGTCLLAALACGGLWVRSYSVSDNYIWPVQSPSGFQRIDSRSLQTTSGRLFFQERTALM